MDLITSLRCVPESNAVHKIISMDWKMRFDMEMTTSKDCLITIYFELIKSKDCAISSSFEELELAIRIAAGTPHPDAKDVRRAEETDHLARHRVVDDWAAIDAVHFHLFHGVDDAVRRQRDELRFLGDLAHEPWRPLLRQSARQRFAAEDTDEAPLVVDHRIDAV